MIIAGAGGAAHLPGMVAAQTRAAGARRAGAERTRCKGMDSLLSIVQMPAGIPVGTLAIGKAGATNAALLAVAILRQLAARAAREARGSSAPSRPPPSWEIHTRPKPRRPNRTSYDAPAVALPKIAGVVALSPARRHRVCCSCSTASALWMERPRLDLLA